MVVRQERAMSASESLDTTRPRWIIVVETARPEIFAGLRRTFQRSPWVEVLLDRRRGERRRANEAPEAERRLGDRRRRDDDRTRVPDYRLAHHGDGHDVFEANALAGARCPECALMVRFEMPRFAEPPASLELAVVHETIQPKHARHFVELESFTSTGRPLLASRVTARVAVESR
jgi:hypothetical protein